MATVQLLRLDRDDKGLGFTLANQFPCVVSCVHQNAPAHRAGLKAGDEIIEVNAVDVSLFTHDEVVEVIKQNHINNTHVKIKVQTFCDKKREQRKSDPQCYNTTRSPVAKQVIGSGSHRNNSSVLKNIFGVTRSFEGNEHYPKFTPVKKSLSNPPPGNVPPVYNVIVYYHCKVDLPKVANIRTSSIEAIDRCLKTTHEKWKNTPSLVKMSMSTSGVQLKNAFGREIANYPLRTIVFSGVSTIDKRYFGLVTENMLTDHTLMQSASFRNSPRYGKSRIVRVCTCHVFMVDEKLSAHAEHRHHAQTFNVVCTPSVNFDGCQEFPENPSTILHELNAFYKERKTSRRVVQSSVIDSDKLSSFTDEKEVIDSTLERLHGVTRRVNTDKLMVRPPSSLSDTAIEHQERYQVKKKANLNQSNNSVKMESTKKPPIAKKASVQKKVLSKQSSMKSETSFTSIKKTLRRKSESMTLASPASTIRDILQRGRKKGLEPVVSPRNSTSTLPTIDTNENLDVSNEDLGRVGLWATSLEHLLSDPIGLKHFQDFLKREFSEENLMFWIACEKYKKVSRPDELKKLADEIFTKHLSHKSRFLVNVDQKAVRKVQENLLHPTPGQFDVPQHQVFRLMRFDSYNRFLKSDIYKDCLLTEQDEKSNKKATRTSKKSRVLSESEDKKKNLINIFNKRERSSSMNAMEEYSTKELNETQLWDGADKAHGFLRVILPDGSAFMLSCVKGSTLQNTLKQLGEEKGIPLLSYDVTLGVEKKSANMDADVTSVEENVIYLEKRVLFRFDLPNGRSVGIKANPNKTIKDILQPVLKKNGFDIISFNIYLMNSKTVLALNTHTRNVENKRLITRRIPRKQTSSSSLDSCKSPMLSDLRASFRKLRSNSFVREEKDQHKVSRKISTEMKHLILGRSKSSEPEGTAALMNVLKRSQSNRIDDQRGMINGKIELPDFLKPATPCNTPMLMRSVSVGTSHTRTFHDELNKKLSDSDICSMQSWSDVPLDERKIIDGAYESKTSLNSGNSNESDELSRSDSNLSRYKLFRKSSAPINRSNGYKTCLSPSTSRTKTDSPCDQSPTNTRPKPVNPLDESMIERCLNSDDFEVIDYPNLPETPTSTYELQLTPKYTPPTPLAPPQAPRDVTQRKLFSNGPHTDKKLSLLEISKRASFNTEPEETEDYSLVSNNRLAEFEGNAIPTPDKGKLLNGETIRGRQNEKITFV